MKANNKSLLLHSKFQEDVQYEKIRADLYENQSYKEEINSDDKDSVYSGILAKSNLKSKLQHKI